MRHVHISVHTPCRTHIFLTVSVSDVQTSRTRMAPGVCSAHVTSLHLTLSILMFRLPCCSLAVTSRPPSRLRRPRLPCRTVPDPKAQVKRTSTLAARRLAAWSIPRTPQVMSPKSSTRSLLWTVTRRPSTIRTTITSLTSPKSHARILSSSVFPYCLKPLIRTFLMVSLFFREKSKKACLRKRLPVRERERARERESGKRRFCDQCCRVDVKEKSTEQY